MFVLCFECCVNDDFVEIGEYVFEGDDGFFE